MAINLDGIVTWLKGWFYDKTEITGFLNNKANQSDLQTLQGTVTSLGETVNGKIDTAGTGLSKSGTTLNHSNNVSPQSSAVFKKFSFDGQGHITGTEDVGFSDLPSHNHTTLQIADPNAHSNIGTYANAFQDEINTKIDTAIGNLQSIKAIEVVSTKPTASADTMNKLYIVAETIDEVQKVNVYYTKQTGSNYEWVKLDDNILDELSIDWSEIENNPFSSSTPSSFAPSIHTHVASAVTDLNAHSNIGSSASTTQATINTKIDTAIGSKASTDHRHGELTKGGGISTTVSATTEDGIVITDYSDSNKLKRTTQLFGYHIKDGYAHNNIGSSATDNQATINTKIDTALGNKLSATKVTSWSSTTSDSNVPSEKLVKDSLDSKQDNITSIVLVPKNTDEYGKIIFYTGDEPSP